METGIGELSGTKGFGIISCYLGWSTKSSNDVIFYKIHNNFISSLFSGDSLHPLGEIIGSRKNPTITIARVIFEFTDEIKPPLLERGLDHNWLQR